MRKRLFFFVAALILTAGPVSFVFASVTDGTIDGTHKYAWGENIGWINFGLSGGNVHVTDSSLSGHGWSDSYGWINLSPSATVKVLNNGEGNLSGYAWGESLGWINFSSVSIDYNGEFAGNATIENDGGRVSFNCSNTSSCSSSNFKVKTDWRPKCNNGIDDDGDGLIDYANDPGCNGYGDGSENSDVRGTSGGAGGGGFMPEVYSQATKSAADLLLASPIIQAPLSLTDNLVAVASDAIDGVSSFFESEQSSSAPAEGSGSGSGSGSEGTPLVFRKEWNLLPSEAIKKFTLAPALEEMKNLTEKVPGIKQAKMVFRNIGAQAKQIVNSAKDFLSEVSRRLNLEFWNLFSF